MEKKIIGYAMTVFLALTPTLLQRRVASAQFVKYDAD
jgi:hypothetical protein